MWRDLPDDVKASHAAASRARWAVVDPRERSQAAFERAKKLWAKRDAEARRTVGTKISKGKLSRLSKEERSRIASEAARALFKGNPNAAVNVSRSMKQWWASMTPEYRTDYLKRRTAALLTAKAAKKTAQALLPQAAD